MEKELKLYKDLDVLRGTTDPDSVYFVLSSVTQKVNQIWVTNNQNVPKRVDLNPILPNNIISAQSGNLIYFSLLDGKLQVNQITSPDTSLNVTSTPTETQIELSVAIQNLINSALQSGDNITNLTGTKVDFNTALTDGDFLFVGDISAYTDEQAQDAVGGILTDTSTIDFTYNDGTSSIEANIVPNSITANELSNSISVSEFINDENYIDHTDLTYTASPTNGTINSDVGTDAVIPLADVTNAGLISPAEKVLIASALQVVDLSYTPSSIDGVVVNTGGTDATLPLADLTDAGLLSPSDKLKLNNTTNVNSGDQNSIVGISGIKSEYNTSLTDGDFLFVGDISQYTDEQAQDAVGSTLTDTTTIDLSYNDGLNQISASIIPNSITATELSSSINISEFLNDSGYITNTNLSYTPSPTTGTVVSDTGTDATIPLADATNAGLFSPSEKANLANQSGVNTGDNATNTQYSGLVSNATHTGDASGATVLTLATVNGDVGTFGSASTTNTITVNGKGLTTAVTNNAIQITESQVTNLTTDLTARELIANKATDLTSPDNTKYPTTLAVANGLLSKITAVDGSGNLLNNVYEYSGIVNKPAGSGLFNINISTLNFLSIISVQITIQRTGTGISSQSLATMTAVPTTSLLSTAVVESAGILLGGEALEFTTATCNLHLTIKGTK